MKTTVVFDLETDGLLDDVTRVWCTGVKYEGQGAYTTVGRSVIAELLQANVIIGHNIIGYDLPVLKKLYGYAPKVGAKLIDTLVLSRMLCKERTSHSLDSWGETLGFPKGEHDDWTQYSQEMASYCIRDVDLTTKLYEHLMEISRC